MLGDLVDEVSMPGQAIAEPLALHAIFLQRPLRRARPASPTATQLRFDDGRKLSLQGLYTVSRDRLDDLDDARIVSLFRKGYLQLALCVSFSLGQVAVLARRRNQLSTNPIETPESARD
ncbi:MAG: SapC family protein [Sphingomonas sp.]|uniref:SapC family protein n=1 Tax=Sphingomonas sp. TaxID=28214 RepID=UPI00227465BC|nr:SapC family protein [Sphingomonas sp.]MCX8476301.1 SapC family protein [Sphingomonas sp.]